MFSDSKILIGAGWVFGGRAKDRAGIGLSIYMPSGSIYQLRQRDPLDSYFPMYENQVQSFELRMGAGFRPHRRVSLGFSVMLLASLEGTLFLYSPFLLRNQSHPEEGSLEAFEAQRMLLIMDQDLPNQTFINAGILIDAGRGIKFGVAYRDESYVKVHLPIFFETSLLDFLRLPVGADTLIITKYSPRRICPGFSYEQENRYLAALSLNYIFYRDYKFPVAELPLEVDLINALGLELIDPLYPEVSMKNVISGQLGGEYWARDWLRVRGGYGYEPSSIQRINLPMYDSNKHTFSIGTGFTFFDFLWGTIPGKTNIDIVFQTTFYERRNVSVTKLKEEYRGNWPYDENPSLYYPHTVGVEEVRQQIGGQVFSGMLTLDVVFEAKPTSPSPGKLPSE